MKIELPVCGIEITVKGSGDKTSGIIVSDLHDEDNDNSNYTAAIDGIEGLLLAMACAGIDLQTPAMYEAIETAVYSCANYYGD